MYGKFINGNLVINQNPLYRNGMVIHNPKAEHYEADGWKIIVDEPYPEEGYYTQTITEEANQITRGWEAAEPPVVGPTPPTVEQRIMTLESEKVTLESTLDDMIIDTLENMQVTAVDDRVDSLESTVDELIIAALEG